jgi:hypothetical protein
VSLAEALEDRKRLLVMRQAGLRLIEAGVPVPYTD